MGKGILINPSSFAEDGGLLDLTMEDVVILFIEQEKRRHKDAKDDENQADVVVSAKATPMGLMAILNLASEELGISRSILTKCLSHQVACWYDSISVLGQLRESFYDAYGKAVSSGHPELCAGFRNSSYQYDYALTDGATTLRTIMWVFNKLSRLATPLGLSPTLLFHVGLCWSVSRSSNKQYQGTINKFLRVEPDKLVRYVGERFIHVKGFVEQVEYRLKS